MGNKCYKIKVDHTRGSFGMLVSEMKQIMD